jgi:hypothetical protein
MLSVVQCWNAYNKFNKVLTRWSRMLYEKLIVDKLVQEFPTFYGRQKFITLLTTACHRFKSWGRRIQFTSCSHVFLRPILILFPYAFSYSNYFLLCGFLIKILCAFLVFSFGVTWATVHVKDRVACLGKLLAGLWMRFCLSATQCASIRLCVCLYPDPDIGCNFDLNVHTTRVGEMNLFWFV